MTNIYYENARDKGFHDEDTFGADGTPDARTRIVFAGLLTTEWREQKIDATSSSPEWWIREDGKPCGELSEWADVWIRCADSLGACSADLTGPKYDVDADRPKLGDCAAFIPWAVAIAVELARKGDHVGYAAVLRETMSYSLWRMQLLLGRSSTPEHAALECIRIKHEYNKTRPRRHGKLA